MAATYMRFGVPEAFYGISGDFSDMKNIGLTTGPVTLSYGATTVYSRNVGELKEISLTCLETDHEILKNLNFYKGRVFNIALAFPADQDGLFEHMLVEKAKLKFPIKQVHSKNEVTTTPLTFEVLPDSWVVRGFE